MDCNPGQVFPIPGFGIQDVVIPGLRDLAEIWNLPLYFGCHSFMCTVL